MSINEFFSRARDFVSNLLAFQYREVLITIATVSVMATSIGFFPGIGKLTTGLQSGVTGTDLFLFIVIAIIAGIIKGTIGFGFALVSTPIFATVIDPTLAVVVLSIPPWMINLFQIGETQTGLNYVRQHWSLLILALLGSVIGVFFLSTINIGPLILFLMGLIILAYVGFQLVMNFTVIEEADHPIGLGAAGFSTGFLMGVTNFGPILSAYLHTFERNTERYVGGLSMVFLLVYTERIMQMSFVGLLTPYRFWLGSAIAVVTLIGLGIGTYLRHLEIDERKFNWLVISVLLIIGLNILRETVPALLI